MHGKEIVTKHSPTIWKYLNGVVNIFKPAGTTVNLTKAAVRINICKNLNSLEVRETRPMITIDPNPTNPNEYAVNIVDNLGDHVLATGPRYDYKDIKCVAGTNLGKHTSGVLLLGVNSGSAKAFHIREAGALRTFHVTGKFGLSTENNFTNSHVVNKAAYGHIYPDRLAVFLASMQASHQKRMYDMMGIDMQSQTAYEIACRGLIRPIKKEVPVIYGIRCIKFQRPFFTLEIHSINETEEYLCSLIQEVGVQMRTVAHCTALRCVQHGHFSADDSLLRGNWNLQAVLNNMKKCSEILKKHPEMLRIDEPDLIMQNIN